MKAFPVVFRAFKAFYEDLFLCTQVSLLWWVGLLLIVTAAPATYGMNAVTNRLANYKRSELGIFWQEGRGRFGKAWLLFALVVVVVALILLNVWFYSDAGGYWGIAAIVWLWVLFVALMVGQYLFPLMCQQNEPDIRLALRNAGVLALRSPLYTAIGLIVQLLIVFASVSLFVPLLLILPGLIALISNFLLTGLLQEMGLADPPPTTVGE
jgi:uncharacterized membrane protein YesL